MYMVKCDDTIIYNDISLSDDAIAYDPNLDIADNKAGTFRITLPPNNPGYNKVVKMVSTISVTKNGNPLWEGRIVKENTNFQNQKTIECEGCLAYLNDVTLPPHQFRANTISDLIVQVLNLYNQRAKANRKIYAGAITVQGNPDIVDYESNYENVLDFINTNLLNSYGGHLFVSRDSTGLKLNYYQDWLNTCTQTIDFGSNLIDFTRDYDFSGICTVCIPRGKQVSENTFDGTSAEQISPSSRNKYVTVEEVNNGSIYVESQTAIETYGRIERVVDFNDVEDPNTLLSLAQIYMSSLQFEDLHMTVKAVDLHVLNSEIESFDLYDQVKCISIPHGLDRYFPITAISIPLNKPEAVQYTMGVFAGGLTASVTAANTQVKAQFEKTSSRESVLVEAFRNADAVLSTKTNGYVNIVSTGEHSQALIISNSSSWKSSNKYWKFDMNGLGYYANGKLQGIAITMNGQIVADYITTGTLSADRIRTGILKDVYNNNVINLETGAVLLQASKTTVKTDSGATYSLATSNDISSVNGKINSVSTQVSSFRTDITGLQSDVYSLEANYGTCNTPSKTIEKAVVCKNFKLKNGSTVIVLFSYRSGTLAPTMNVNNTGAYPIKLNGKAIGINFGGKSGWGDGETVSFVFGNNAWNVADGSTESHIRQLADSISLSVTGKLGQTASIVLSADGETETRQIDMSNVRQAFRDDNSAITVSAGKITFNSGTFVLNSTNCSISEDGTITASNAVLMSSNGEHGEHECKIEDGGIYFYRREYDVGVGILTGITYRLRSRTLVAAITTTYYNSSDGASIDIDASSNIINVDYDFQVTAGNNQYNRLLVTNNFTHIRSSGSINLDAYRYSTSSHGRAYIELGDGYITLSANYIHIYGQIDYH